MQPMLTGEVGMQPLLQRVFQPSSVTVKRDGRSRFCQKCNLPKHDRAHHCRTCKKCVLKMDHSLYCIVVFSTALPETIRVWNSPMGILALDLNWPFLVLFSGLFGMFLIPFTIFHTNQLMTNRTTVELYERSNYSMGSRRNRDVLTSRFFNAWNLGYK
ncbi:hypothetical protein INT43_006778 [Umbelopsis isabellina]|uniref:Palmitoyltransferase n=1 Tax=Mortierella isabellina TaxID=91625 RepID=A0A8H7Q0N8_MORIS|nr:hypothetical protein INT43_006778 [Umbelopsis isabellina]